MKKIFLRMATVVILLVVVFSLSACSADAANNETINTDNRLIVVSTQDISSGKAANSKYVTIVYDPNTLVMYSVTFGESSNSRPSALLPLYNADGTLQLYTPSNSNEWGYWLKKEKYIFFSSKEVSFLLKNFLWIYCNLLKIK